MSEEVGIIWHGHSCFEINTAAAVIILDPYQEDRKSVVRERV